MADIKSIVAKNISRLRVSCGMTQIDLAEKLNYSDKAVSKWERGESIPDITVLKDIADMFGVTLDYLVTDNDAAAVASASSDGLKKNNRTFISAMSVLLVWLVATIVFVVAQTALGSGKAFWISFISFATAIPVSLIVWLVFNSIWFDRKRNFLIISLLMWSVLLELCLILTTLTFSGTWLILALGIPGQIIIILWSKIKRK